MDHKELQSSAQRSAGGKTLNQQAWLGTNSILSNFVADETESALNAYRARKALIREHSNIEQQIVQSGYGRKQLYELIQNATDALDNEGGRIKLVLTADALYCANEGDAFSRAGYTTLMLSHSSDKRDDEIGRFGLGFKSVIQISDSPQIYSRSGSVSWDRARSTRVLAELLPGLETYPLLRLATPIDPLAAAENDAVLADLMSWATTVVKLPIAGSPTWLSTEFSTFPHEFLLFSENARALEFDDQTSGKSIRWTAERNGTRVRLNNGVANEDWRLFRHTWKVSPQAAVDAGSIAARESVEVTWAVPVTLTGRRRGSFWNYFPTKHQTSLSGIVNSSFKMNEDRHSMLESRYNREILERALPVMVASSLAELAENSDPAQYLDLLPARGREPVSWADKVINEPIFSAIAQVPCLPDRSGILRQISEVRVQPDLEEATRLTGIWESSVESHRPWLHSSALKDATRRSQVARLLSNANAKRASVEEWLEEIVVPRSLGSFEAALRTATLIERHYPELRQGMRRSQIVQMQDGSVRAPITSKVFLPLDGEDEGENLVSYELLQYGECAKLLKELDLQALDGRGKINRVARQVHDDYEDIVRAESLWRLSRSLPVAEIQAILTDKISIEKLLVRTQDRKWRPFDTVWRPGGLFGTQQVGDEHLVVDEQFHRPDIPLMRGLGMLSGLPESKMLRGGPTFLAWTKSEANRLSEHSRRTPSPVSAAGLRFSPAHGTEKLELLATASEKTRAKITQLLLQSPRNQAVVAYSNTYNPPITVDGPDYWWIREYGVLQTRLGLVETRHCVGDIPDIPAGFLPYPGPEVATKLALPTDVAKVNWKFIVRLAEATLPLERVHELYGVMAQMGVRPPTELLVRLGTEATTRYPVGITLVTTNSASMSYLVAKAQQPVILAMHEDLANALQNSWKLERTDVEFIETFEIDEDDSSPAQPVLEHFPGITTLESKVRATLRCIPCTDIRTITVNTFDQRRDVVHHGSVLKGTKLFYNHEWKRRQLLAAVLQHSGSSQSAADVNVGLKRMKLLPPPDSPSGPASDVPVKALQTHAKGKIPLRTDRNLMEQVELVQDAIVKYLESEQLELLDITLNIEADVATGFDEATVQHVIASAKKLGGRMVFDA
ncbi:sacsin N-terminal ATP-binding-like domain-containing protein [Arthrobacter rhombi]|uniref:sacsin N-terminal ATP-binding-like domain-containing protein n=1 Tax=Arthrobacter rhombi TaxID=71253 RepID=UPI003FD1EDB0